MKKIKHPPRQAIAWRRVVGMGLMLWAVMVAAPVLAQAQGEADTATVQKSEQELSALIDQLGDDDYFVREDAQNQLLKLGTAAFDLLIDAEDHDDPEVNARIAYILRRLGGDWIVPDDPPEVQTLVNRLLTSEPVDRDVPLKQMASLQDDIGLPALCRRVRFTNSALESKQAAYAVLISKEHQSPDWQRRREIVSKNLGTSRRPGAQWLRNWVELAADGEQAARSWGELAAQEAKLLDDAPHLSRPDFVKALWRRQAASYLGINQRDAALGAMRQIVAIESGDIASLTELLDELTTLEAWDLVDQAEVKFRDSIHSNLILTYLLARAHEKQGHANQVQELLKKARELPDKDAAAHRTVAAELRRRGMLPWSELEFRRCIELADKNSELAYMTITQLSELLHEQMREDDAATAREMILPVLKEFEGRFGPEVVQQFLRENQARIEFFRSSACKLRGDREQELSHLKLALDHDTGDIDTLIALFHYPNLDNALRERVRENIKTTVATFRAAMQADPNSAINFNQLAWLIANTEGDFSEALMASQRSLELSPNEAGYFDTLGRCYYALDNFEEAVRSQQRAVSLDPYSGTMDRQLEIFKKALAAGSKVPE